MFSKARLGSDITVVNPHNRSFLCSAAQTATAAGEVAETYKWRKCRLLCLGVTRYPLTCDEVQHPTIDVGVNLNDRQVCERGSC